MFEEKILSSYQFLRSIFGQLIIIETLLKLFLSLWFQVYKMFLMTVLQNYFFDNDLLMNQKPQKTKHDKKFNRYHFFNRQLL